MEIENAEGFEPQESQDPQVPETDPALETLFDTVKDLEGAPTMGDLEMWKDIHGVYFASTILADDNIYIWKTLKRADYRRLASSGAMDKEDIYKEQVTKTCLLWPQPRPEWMAVQDAGTIPTLFKQIMFKSGFVSEEMALALINPI